MNSTDTRISRQAGPEPEMRTCFVCNDLRPIDEMETFDISREDEYYPNLRYLCWSCASDSE